MRKALLLFPDVASLTAFIFEQRISGLEVNTRERRVSGMLTEQQIVMACTQYKAELVTRVESWLLD
ncbi:MAG: hypothetical protein EOO10_18370 [Chitinophagaceae bacterium]|nr:MAG: hypothetical protein EOO10_18370 [Chitinophagaceae bacterium]